MLIVADENIPLLDEFFGGLGEVRRLPGRTLSAADVAGADVLLVRSVTRVDARLLGGRRPRFVGSATIGTDHVDLAWLAGEGIPFSAAPGCNARAVAEYVATVLALYARDGGDWPGLAGRCLGVVGCGNVGREVVAVGQALGMRVVVCDPFLPPAAFPAGVVTLTLDELLASADVVTLHVPLTRSGMAPTHHLIDEGRLACGSWQLLLNTSRGAVVDNAALLRALQARPGRRVVLDVWEKEPNVPGELLDRVWLGTPHVAGYSLEGKWRGTEQVYRAACAALGGAPSVSLADVLQQRGDRVEEVAWTGTLAGFLAGICPVTSDTERLRGVVGADGRVSPERFDALRRDYAGRREFAHFRVRGAAGHVAEPAVKTKTPQDAAALLAGLGFNLAG